MPVLVLLLRNGLRGLEERHFAHVVQQVGADLVVPLQRLLRVQVDAVPLERAGARQLAEAQVRHRLARRAPDPVLAVPVVAAAHPALQASCVPY